MALVPQALVEQAVQPHSCLRERGVREGEGEGPDGPFMSVYERLGQRPVPPVLLHKPVGVLSWLVAPAAELSREKIPHVEEFVRQDHHTRS